MQEYSDLAEILDAIVGDDDDHAVRALAVWQWMAPEQNRKVVV
jgi:hypothetical protein